MKISIEIDCSPEEARRFFGLPDVTHVNEAVVETVQARMAEALKQIDGETLLREWMASGTQAWQNLQTSFMDQMRNAMSGQGRSGGTGT
jgi:hypothetical protein